MSPTNKRRLIGVGLAIVAALLSWYLNTNGDSTTPTTATGTTTTAAPTGSVDPDSGLPWMQVSELPLEGRELLALIDAGGPFPDRHDGLTFENREEILPDGQAGHYREYTVETPGSGDRGARRIVAGADGEFYYTDDHYQSFRRIAR